MAINSHLQMALDSIGYFHSDGKMDVSEMKKIFDVALRDGIVDDDEKRVMNEIIQQLSPSELDADMLKLLDEIKTHL